MALLYFFHWTVYLVDCRFDQSENGRRPVAEVTTGTVNLGYSSEGSTGEMVTSESLDHSCKA